MITPGRAACRMTFTSSRVRSISTFGMPANLYFSVNVLADLVIFHQQIGKFLLRGIPAALPADHDAGAETDWIDFLTHKIDLGIGDVVWTGRSSEPVRITLLTSTYSIEILMCAIRFLTTCAMPRAPGRTRLNIGPPSIRASTIRRPPTFGARRSSALPRALLHHLLQHPRAALRLVLQDGQRIVDPLAANQVSQRPHLAGADLSMPMCCCVCHVLALSSQLSAFSQTATAANLG